MKPTGRNGARRRGMAGLLAAAVIVSLCRAPLAFAQTPVTTHPFKPGLYRGSLGDAKIEMRLSWQAGVDESLEGSYIVFGKPDTVLVVGEFEGAEFVLEESHNGRDVSGAWSGRLEGDRLSGTWSNEDGSVELPFDLVRIAALVPS